MVKLFEQCFELEDIESVEESGYKNVYDISVSGDHTFLLGNGIVSHNSALGGILPVFGRKEMGYYVLKGKPLNAITATQAKFTNNVELSELFTIIKNEGYTNIVFGTDADLDGIHIRGLLLGFFKKYLTEKLENLYILDTPVIAIEDKNEKMVKWVYSLNDDVELKKGEHASYKKGLGSWNEDDLKLVLQTDGLDKMLNHLIIDDDAIINDWLDKDSAPRKEYIKNNVFNIASA